MQVGVYYNNNDVRLEERPVPKISPEEILVKVVASGICGSDVMEWYRIKKAPIVLGHEITGEIVEVGEKVVASTPFHSYLERVSNPPSPPFNKGGTKRGFKVGDRVFVSHHVPCNTCRYCLNGNHTVCETLHTTNYDPGGFAEYIRVPKINVDRGVFILPDEVSYEDGVFIEPLACVVRGQRLAQIKPTDTVLILGSGIAGLLHIALAKAMGVGRIIATDVNEYRLNAAKKFGAITVINVSELIPPYPPLKKGGLRGDFDEVAEKVRQANEGRLADVVIICTGAFSAFKQALQSVDRSGTILFFATTEPGVEVPIPVNEFWRNGIKLLPSYGGAPLDIVIAIDLLRNRVVPVNDMITHRLSLSEIGSGFKLVAEGKESIKVIVKP